MIASNVVNFYDEPDEPEPEAQEWNADLSSAIDYEIPFEGLARDIQQWIISTSIKRQPALAFAATIAVLSTVYGRSYSLDGIKGNVMLLCLADSAEGKDWPLKAAGKLLDSCGYGDNIHGQMASGAALVDAVVEHPNSLLALDEIGHYFSSINCKTSNQYSREIMPIITRMYTDSSDVFREKGRKDKPGRVIREPNLCVLGMTTERQILDSLKSTEVMDGSLARFLVIFGEKNVPHSRGRVRNKNVPEPIADALKDRKDLFSMTNDFRSRELNVSEDYLAEKDLQDDSFHYLSVQMDKEGGDRAVFKTLYKRVSVMALQLAMLIDGAQDADVYNWCIGIVVQSADVFIKKFMHMCADNDNERYSKILQRVIKEAGKEGIKLSDLTRRTQAINPSLKKQLLAEFIGSGLVFERLEPCGQRPITRYFWQK